MSLGRKKDKDVADIKAGVEDIVLEHHHITHIFPEDTNETVTFTAGGTANIFGAWIEIEDNNGVKLSSKFTQKIGHISAVMIEDTSIKDKRYLIEVAYGSTKVFISRHRFVAGETTNLPAVQQIRVKAENIPAGEKLYYRMKCETAGETAELCIRYHYH